MSISPTLPGCSRQFAALCTFMKLSLSWSPGDPYLPAARRWADRSRSLFRKTWALRHVFAVQKLSALLANLDSPSGTTAPTTWLVQCVLSRRQDFGTVTIVTTSSHAAADEDEAKLLGMQAAATDRPQYRLDLVTATPFRVP